MEKTFDKDAKDHHGLSFMHYLGKRGTPEMFVMFIKWGINHDRNVKGQTRKHASPQCDTQF